jgi:hypothetical protein
MILLLFNLGKLSYLAEVHPGETTQRSLFVVNSIDDDIMPDRALITTTGLLVVSLLLEAGTVLEVGDGNVSLSLGSPYAELLKQNIGEVSIRANVLQNAEGLYLCVPAIQQYEALDISSNFTSFHE